MKIKNLITIISLSVLILACSTYQLRKSENPIAPSPKEFILKTSYYGEEFQGKKTASGEIFDSNSYTAAHKTFPFNTRLEVINPETGKKVYVRVNDRGPYVPGRDLDLSKAAALKIGLIESGSGNMKVIVVQ